MDVVENDMHCIGQILTHDWMGLNASRNSKIVFHFFKRKLIHYMARGDRALAAFVVLLNN